MPAAVLTLPLEQLPDPLPIEPLKKPFDVTIRPPGSKSITNRALLLAALAEGTSTLRGALIDADDAQVMIRALEQLGAGIEIERAPSASSGLDQVRITGVAGRWKIPAGKTVHLDLHNAGTATRFLAAAAILAPPNSGGVIIDGDARMRERPIGELGEALAALGAETEYLGAPGHPPIRVLPLGDSYSAAASIAFGRTASSQFVSALALVAPFLPRGLTIQFTDAITSAAYVHMTAAMLERLGVDVEWEDEDRPLQIRPASAGGLLPAFDLQIEPDASGATYFWAAAMIGASRVTITALGRESTLQGDSRFLWVIDKMGARVDYASSRADSCVRAGPRIGAIAVDLSDMPDTAMTAAVLACFASPTPNNPTGTSTLRGLRTLRVKETDRLAALKAELSKIGAKVDIFSDGDDEGLRITPGPSSPAPVIFETYNDHRMAMALALIGLRRPNVFISNPACVRKTYPGYWRDFARLYA